MAIISISDSQINSADQVLVADASSKIPAKDGSQITVLNATNVASGTIATARLDTGTTANKIVVLDGSGNLPVVDGSLLTGIVSATVSASDPTVSTNPSAGLGAEWNNSTSGEMYICTDATAGANVWTNVGAGTGNIPILYAFQGSQYGYALGGNWPTINNIQRFAFASNTTGSDVGDIAAASRYSAAGMPNNPTNGYTMSGGDENGYTTAILRLSFASGTQNTVDTSADIPSAGHYLNVCGASNGINGYGHGGYGIVGGDTPANRIICREIYKFNFATEANATVCGSQIGTHGRGYTAGACSTTHGYTMGGVDIAGTTNVTDTIQKFSMESDADATDVGNCTDAVRNLAGASSTTHGYAMGGYDNSSLQNMVDKFSFSSDGNATDIGNLTVSRHSHTGASSTTHGFNVGGTGGNQIDKIAFATDGNMTDHGDLYTATYLASALHF